MATITSYTTKTGTRYRVRYRKPDGTQTDKRGFKTKRAAQDWAAKTRVDLKSGAWVDPVAGRATVTDMHELWWRTKANLKPSYLRTLEGTWDVHVKPQWGDRTVQSIMRPEVAAWAATLTKTRSASVVHRCLDILAGILDTAIDARALHHNPARGFPRPRKPGSRRTYLSWIQLLLLASSAGTYGPLLLFLGTTGLRWGEAVALRGKHVDRGHCRVTVEVSMVRVRGVDIVGTPKGHEARTVPVPRAVMRCLPNVGAGELVFPGAAGGYMSRPNTTSGWWITALGKCRAADETFPAEFRVHDLRHTAASLAVSAGANVKAVQRMLGHASATLTLDTYTDLFDADLDAVASALDTQLRAVLSK